ncbi:MAG TPA: DNA integrity scanning protein DisA, partial [Firmicutes bacterium]|nr:DNA integrity scanning protein DisA [Bacillota bacterium]
MLHEALESIIRARTGALVVIGDHPEVMKVVSGGLRLDCPFGPSRLYELAKMDGAIIIDRDIKKIVLANAQLIPDPSIPSEETGSRHRTAQRTAKETGALVIAVSQRRNVVTLYRGNMRYVVREIGVTLAKANQALQTLEKFRSILDQARIKLTVLEFEGVATVGDVVWTIQRGEMLNRVTREVERYVAELGVEGRLIEMQLKELISGVEPEASYTIRDYIVQDGDRTLKSVRDQLRALSFDDLVDQALIARILGFTGAKNVLDEIVSPRGYRILSKLPHIPFSVVDNIVGVFGNLQDVIKASPEELDKVEGVGESRARGIKEGLRRLRQ